MPADKPVFTLSFIEPADPVLQEEPPPPGAGWVHEIKQGGFRTQLILELGQVRAFSRSGFDWTDRYPAIVTAAQGLPATSAIVDGGGYPARRSRRL